MKDKLNDTNCIHVLHYTENILGLDTTMVKQTMEFVCKRLMDMAGEKDSLALRSDPDQDAQQEQFTPDLVKIMMKSEHRGSCVKYNVRKWISKNVEAVEKIFEMLNISHLMKYCEK